MDKHTDQEIEAEEFDVPEEIEDILGELFNALQDRVREVARPVHLHTIHYIHRILSSAGLRPRALLALRSDCPQTSPIKFWKL